VTDFGGLGGAAGGRPRDPTDLFKSAVERALGEQIRACRDPLARFVSSTATVLPERNIAQKLWCSLVTVYWRHDNGNAASYTFRTAGDLIAAICGEGDYMDWCCSAPYGQAFPEIAEALAKEGWRPVEEAQCD
jgi:hypothetical protein